MSIITKIRESFRTTEVKSISKVINSYDWIGERPEVSFKDSIKYFESTPQIRLAVTSFHVAVVGESMKITAKDPEAEKILNDYADLIDLYPLVRESELVAEIGGEQLIEKVGSDFVLIDMATIEEIQRKSDGTVKQFIQRIQGEEIMIPANKVLRLQFEKISSSPWARGMFYSLTVARTVGDVTTRPLVEQLWLMEDGMTEIFINMANPMMWITYEDANREFLEEEAKKIKSMKAGDKIVGDRKPAVTIHEVNPTGKFDSYVKHFKETIMMGSGYSYEIFLGNFTSRASSETTETELTKMIQARKRLLCNFIKKQMLQPILMTHKKWNTKEKVMEAGIEVVFQDPNNVTYVPADMKDADYLSKEEKREFAKVNGGLNYLNVSDVPPDPVEPQVQDLQTKINELETELKQSGKDNQIISELKHKLTVRESLDTSEKRRISQEVLKAITRIGSD